MELKQWYLEYKIHKNRPGLLGDIASMLGMLEINILTINGVEGKTRGLLLESDDDGKIDQVSKMLSKVDSITVTALRCPRLVDLLAVRHGRYIDRDSDDKKTFRFTRDELGILVDFLGEISSGRAIRSLVFGGCRASARRNRLSPAASVR
ncbi:hypothetical protein HMSSN036_35860 [Paenibacillus macerans]|nr:hypothetical protein HMSSN036_35860 [Paenibacillus macerans]